MSINSNPMTRTMIKICGVNNSFFKGVDFYKANLKISRRASSTPVFHTVR
jgi:hypothetical protein